MTSIDVGDIRARKVRLAAAVREKRLRENRRLQQQNPGGLIEFVRYFWDVLEPVDPFVDGWPLECLCAHLEAITRNETIVIGDEERDFNRLLANVPPGFMKSLLVNVFWPAFEWGPMGLPHLRYVAFSYASELTERDNAKFRNLITSRKYQEMWGHVFKVIGDGKIRVTNDKTGFKFASSFGGVSTGERGHRVLLDDPHKLKGTSETDEAREAVVTWVIEAMQNRLNDLKRDAIIVIMQRVHEADTSGAIMKRLGDEYCHLLIPMVYEQGRHFSHYTGWNDGVDPRTEDGELAWPDRYAPRELASFKRNPVLWSGQYQQNPTPRGGGIFKDDWWQVHQVVRRESGGYRFVPDITPVFVLASLDTAFSEKEENDYSALTVWVAYDDPRTKHRHLLLADAWHKKLSTLHGETTEQEDGESEGAYRRRASKKWGLVEWVNHTCTVRKVDTLLVENKNRGHDVVKEIKRLHANRNWGIRTVEPRGDKWSRAHAIVDLFTDDMVYAPAEITEEGDVRFLDWANVVMEEVSRFPRGAHDDLVDSMTMALKFLRDNGLAPRREELRDEEVMRAQHKGGQRGPLYPA